MGIGGVYREIVRGILLNAGLGGFSDSAVSSDNWDNITKTGIYSAQAGDLLPID